MNENDENERKPLVTVNQIISMAGKEVIKTNNRNKPTQIEGE